MKGINDSPFRIGSSSVDWCEPNYAVSEHIAEFWNTVSNVFFFLVPPIMIILFIPYSKRISKTILVLWFLLIIIGVGSVYFHATLSIAGQLLDEIGILWVLMFGYGLFLPSAFDSQLLYAKRNRIMYFFIGLAFITTLLCLFYPYANAFALMILGLPAIVFLIVHVSKCDNNDIKYLGIHCVTIWAVAVTLWISDRVFCSFWISISFPYLHSIWHVLILFSSTESIVVCAYLLLKYQYAHANITLHRWPNENWKIFSLPYLEFHNDISEKFLV